MRNCSECDEPISAKRLAAVPDATMCVRCQRDNDVLVSADSRAVRNALVERSERDGGQYQNRPEPHECLKLK